GYIYPLGTARINTGPSDGWLWRLANLRPAGLTTPGLRMRPSGEVYVKIRSVSELGEEEIFKKNHMFVISFRDHFRIGEPCRPNFCKNSSGSLHIRIGTQNCLVYAEIFI